MSQRLQELCALLIEDTAGNLCAQIFTLLAENGRCSRLQLQQHTRIPARQLKTALAILAQQHFILHYTAEDEPTFYQVDWRNTYSPLRSNRIISLVEERYGQGAGQIVGNLLQLGHARVEDLAQAFDLPSTARRDRGMEDCGNYVNGDARINGTDPHKTDGNKITTVSEFHHTLRTLLRAGFVVKLGRTAYTPAADLQHAIEEAVISDQFPDRKVTGPKKQAEFKLAVNSLKRKWRDNDEYSERRDTIPNGTAKYAGRHPAKRSRLNVDAINGVDHSHRGDVEEGNAPKLPSDMVLRVNYVQCTLAFRTHRLEQLVEPYLGGVTAHVYGALLQVLEGKARARDDDLEATENTDDEDDDSPVGTTVEVAELLDPLLDLTLGIHGLVAPQKLPNGGAKEKTKGRTLDPEFADIGIKQEFHSDDENDHPVNGFGLYHESTKRLSIVEEHLKLLEEHPKSFCRRVGGGGRGEWQVNFPALTDTLVQADIDSMILARYGKVHTRIVRLLRERGRLEEKQVSALAMMRLKDLRAVLTELQYAGLVEAQEVPRDAMRQPARTHYLWFHDQSRVQSTLLQQTYQGMSRTLQRLRQERETYKGAIEKAELVDVKQDTLTQNEREAIMQWREVEEKLLTQVLRMDEMVALFRDFSGRDTSMVS